VQPVQPGSPGFQPERRVTRIEGGVSNRGPASVAAMATPLGRYKKALSDAIGSRWYFYVRNEIGLLAVGTITIRFQVMSSGRVVGVQVLTNSSNESFAAISIRSIMDAEIPPIPPEVSELLENNRIEVDYTFSILSN
jgi:outer membrane biosynthesis protein TonB